MEKVYIKDGSPDHLQNQAIDILKQDRIPPSLKEALFGFTQNTTLHGIRYIFLDHISAVRRLFWIVLFMACSVLMSVQIVERIVHYYNYPVTVNVHVNFNKTLDFPALTICNQNAFRATAATRLDLYELLDELYSRDDGGDVEQLMTSNVSQIRLNKLFSSLAHRKEDLIVSCEWQHEPCGPDNFSEILTDHGVCYNFNDDITSPLLVTSTGSDYGLKLTLNVEQYEYMPGPHSSAGIKILLHDHREFPKVAELGLAIPTGTHAYVGIQLLKIQNLPKPHGSCRSEHSPYYNQYSPDACLLTCMTEQMAKICGCRQMYMPSVDDYPPICTLEQYLGCYKIKIAEVQKYVRDYCECPVPCEFLIYDPTISFASTSNYATDRLLAATSIGSLQSRYSHARETTAREEKLQFQRFRQLEEDMSNKFQELKTVIKWGVKERLKTQKQALESMYSQVKRVRDKKKHLLEWQQYHVNKNFIRPRQAMEERTLFSLVLGYQEFSFQIESVIKQLSTPPGNLTFSEDVRTSMYANVLNILNGRVDLAERAYDNYTQLYGAYYNGTPIFRYQFRSEPRDDNIFITPKILLNNSLFHNSYARKYGARVGDDIIKFKEALLNYVSLADKSYFQKEADLEEIYQGNILFLVRGRRFYHSKSTFYAEVIEYPAHIMTQRIEEFERRWREFIQDFNFVYDQVTQLFTNLSILEETIMNYLEEGIQIAQNYLIHKNVTKMQVAEVLTSDDIHKGISQMENVFANIRSRGQSVYDGWMSLVQSVSDVWQMVLVDEDMQEYYMHKNMTEYLQEFATVQETIEGNITEYRDDQDFRFVLGNLDSRFLISLQKMMVDMKEYIEGRELETNFIRKNFLQLAVFYKEKSYEQINQQEAYDLFALLCEFLMYFEIGDIGGSMGLFVGASVMTICEILDLGLHHFIYKLTHRIQTS